MPGGDEMEDRESPVLYLEMTDSSASDCARTRVPEVRALPTVPSVKWWRNVYRDRPDLPREIPEFDAISVETAEATERRSVAELAAHLVSRPEAEALSGGELV